MYDRHAGSLGQLIPGVPIGFMPPPKVLLWLGGRGKLDSVERELRVFRSFDEADRADDDYYASLSAAECLDITLTLIAAHRENTGEAGSRFERVYRVTQLASG